MPSTFSTIATNKLTFTAGGTFFSYCLSSKSNTMTGRHDRLTSLLLLLLLPLAVMAQVKRFNEVSFNSLTPLEVSARQGVSGHFSGTFGNELLVAGGCNFPDTPAAEGGEKRFYDDIYVLTNPLKEGSRWQKAGKMHCALAYGASVSVPEGVVCIGGTQDGKKSENAVFLLQISANGKVKEQPLPALPVALDQMAAAYGSGYLYVAGGQSHGKASFAAFRMKYTEQGKAGNWERLPDFAAANPENARIQPCAVVQNGSTGPRFYLFGGFSPVTQKTQTDGIAYDIKSATWTRTSPILPSGKGAVTTALSGATAVTSGFSSVLFFGGVNKQVFEQALAAPSADYLTHVPEWYKFGNRILVYQTITDAWTFIDQDERLARAGASVAPFKDTEGNLHWLLVNGESKPGMRSAAVTDVEMTYTAHFGWLNWSVLIVYLLAMILLGVYFMRRQKGGDDFIKGGGRIPWWAAGISIFATMLSAITYMSIPAKAYATDWTYYPMQICILLVSFPVIKYYLPFFRRLKVDTAYEYLERRFNYATRLMASVLFIVFMVLRMALVLFLPSLAMTAVTGIDIFICIVLMAVITIAYCTMGGVEAVVWGDVIQGFILVGGAILAAGYLIANTGSGAGDFFQIAWENDKLRLFDWSFDWRNATFWVVILGGLANNLISYTSDQTVIQRYLTTKDEKSAARGILTNGLMSVSVTIAFFTIGTGLYTFFKTHPAEMDMTMAKSDAIFPFFMMSQLPAGIAGLLIAAVFAATMSTIASNINSVATAFTMDIWKKARKSSVGNNEQMQVLRWASVLSGVVGMLIAILMATVNIQSLLDYFNTILGLLSGGIGGLFIMGIFFPRINSASALIGFLCGTAVVFWMQFGSDVNFLLFGFVSMTVSVIVALLLSFVWQERRTQNGLTWSTLPKEEQE